MLVHGDGAVPGGSQGRGRHLLQKSFLRAATSGAGRGTIRTRADGQTGQTSEVREVGEIAAVTATCAIALGPAMDFRSAQCAVAIAPCGSNGG